MSSPTKSDSGLRQRKNLPSYPSSAKFAQPGMESMRHSLKGVSVSFEEADAILQQLADNDSDKKKTWSRVFVERFLLDAADTRFRRAEPGEHQEETELYDPFRTPQNAFIEWGVGIDLYFVSVMCFAFFMFVAACVNVASMEFYGSEDYNRGAGYDSTANVFFDENGANIPFDLKHSAICANVQWVVCQDCTEQQWENDKTRFAKAADGTILVLRNFCDGAQDQNAFTSYATLLFAVVFISLVSYYLRARGVRFDEDKITTSDYSVNVKNPPPDAYDPQEWHDFFMKFATGGDQVTCVTVTLDNEELLKKTFYYRNSRGQLLLKIPADTDVDDEEATWAAIKAYRDSGKHSYFIRSGCIGWILKTLVFPPLNIFGMFLPAEKLYEKMLGLKKEIKELQEKDYSVSQIFVTFEKENGQRTALSALQLGVLDILTDNKKAVASNCLFKDKLLHVVQPAEPNAIRWLDLDDKPKKIFTMSVITLLLNVGFIAFATVCIFFARRNVGPFFSGILVTAFNSTIPQVIKIIM
ncbi:MAG: hypothetical protein SGILL_004673, partial [Bacillariaceae sp.]